MLLERGAITGEQLLRAVKSQQSVGGRIGTCLLEMDVLNEETLLQTLSEQLKVPAVNPGDLRQIDEETLALIPSQVAQRCHAIPFLASSGDVRVAVLDVHNLATLDELTFCTSKRVHPHIANEVRIFQALESHYGQACPSRYSHLLDRLEGQSYHWQEGTLLADGSPVWKGQNGSPAAAEATEAPSSPDEAATQPTATLTGQELAASTTAKVDETKPSSEASKPPKRLPEPLIARVPEPAPASDKPIQQPKPPSRFADIERLLANQTNREMVGQIVLRTLATVFHRSALFKVHRDTLRGWMSRGQGFDRRLFADLELSLKDSSVFRHLKQGSEIYIGPLPHSPAHRRMACTWGGDLPKDCLMMPIRVKGRMVSVVYVDNGMDGLLQPDVDGLRFLVEHASKAFEWCILRKKSQQQYDERGR